jgi:hypothetical protein
MKILIIEDADFMARGFMAALSEQGHQVDWLVGARSLQPFVGIDNDKQDVQLDPANYDVVFCDGELIGPNMGPAVVRELVSRGICCIGISSTPDLNKQMTDNGAVAAFLKVSAFAAVVEKVLTMESARQPSPALCDAVNAFDQRIREDKDLRRKLDGIIQSFLQN